NLTWSSSNVEIVKIEYSINNGVSWKTIADTLPSTGSYNWKVPETPSYQCKIRISDANKPDIMDISDNTFTIARLELLTPSAGESILTGSLYAITWESECINNVKLDYSTDKGATWTNIAQSVTAINGTYNWAVPAVNIPQCLVRIFDANNPSIYEITGGTVSIQQIVVVSPEEKVRWKMGAVQTITWKSYNVNNVKLEYSTDNGQKWNIIAASVTAKLGSFEWAVPQTPSDLCIVKISDVANTMNFNNNRGNFSIGNTTGISGISSARPESFMLYQNHPNPFNPSTRIRYQVSETEFVSLKVYDTMGKEVCVLVNEEQGPGIYEAVFDGINLANGVYIYRLQAGKYMQARKLILMK
ncbi:MAG: T9SS type A sorting domain-containing protein, partial [Syntrophothermus sp.]